MTHEENHARIGTPVIVESELAMAHLGQLLAAKLLPGDIIRLEGPLGAGKTALARGIVQALTTADENVPSPTFSIVQTYNGQSGEIWHFDLYRLNRPDEIWELGFEDAIEHCICLIEWPEKAEELIPLDALTVSLDAISETSRQLTFSTVSTHISKWTERICSLTDHFEKKYNE